MEHILQPGDVCLRCQQLGLKHNVRYFYINLTEQIVKCESDTCMYPYNEDLESDYEEEEEKTSTHMVYNNTQGDNYMDELLTLGEQHCTSLIDVQTQPPTHLGLPQYTNLHGMPIDNQHKEQLAVTAAPKLKQKIEIQSIKTTKCVKLQTAATDDRNTITKIDLHIVDEQLQNEPKTTITLSHDNEMYEKERRVDVTPTESTPTKDHLLSNNQGEYGKPALTTTTIIDLDDVDEIYELEKKSPDTKSERVDTGSTPATDHQLSDYQAEYENPALTTATTIDLDDVGEIYELARKSPKSKSERVDTMSTPSTDGPDGKPASPTTTIIVLDDDEQIYELVRKSPKSKSTKMRSPANTTTKINDEHEICKIADLQMVEIPTIEPALTIDFVYNSDFTALIPVTRAQITPNAVAASKNTTKTVANDKSKKKPSRPKTKAKVATSNKTNLTKPRKPIQKNTIIDPNVDQAIPKADICTYVPPSNIRKPIEARKPTKKVTKRKAEATASKDTVAATSEAKQ